MIVYFCFLLISHSTYWWSWLSSNRKAACCLLLLIITLFVQLLVASTDLKIIEWNYCTEASLTVSLRVRAVHWLMLSTPNSWTLTLKIIKLDVIKGKASLYKSSCIMVHQMKSPVYNSHHYHHHHHYDKHNVAKSHQDISYVNGFYVSPLRCQ